MKMWRKTISLNYLPILGLIAFGLLTYSNSLHSPFYFDDFHNIQENRHIRMATISWDNIKEVLHSPSKNRPFSNLSFAVNYYFDQYNALGYHIVNLLIHIFTGLFLFIFIKNTFQANSSDNSEFSDRKKDVLISFFAALIWLVHPVNTQSVTYIVQRMTSMASMFYILSLLFYVKFRLSTRTLASFKRSSFAEKIKTYLYLGGCIFSGIVAMMCKETAATLPVFIFIYEWFFLKNLNPGWLKNSILYLSGIILLFVVLGLIFLGGNPLEKVHSLYISTLSIQHFSLSERLLTEIRVLLFYISLFVFPNPSRLHLDYIYPISHSFIDPITTIICLTGIFCLFVLTIFTAKKQRFISFGIIWFFGNLMIESTFIGLAPIYEHRTYLPFMMLSLILVLIVNKLIRTKWTALALMGIIVCVLSSWTYQRNLNWQDRSTFWQDNILKSPSNPRPIQAYGNILLNEGKIEAAIEQYKKALHLKTDYNQIYISLGDAFSQMEQFDNAIRYYSKGLLISPENIEILNKLGNALVQKNEYDQAMVHYTKALKIDPDDAMTHNNISAAFFYKNELNQSVDYYFSALEIQPDYPEARINLALALTKLGKINGAIAQYKHVIRQTPENVEANKNLANLFFSQNNLEDAIQSYQNILKFDPENEQVHYNLGIAFYHNKNIAAAISHIKEAIRINPDYVQAKQALTQLKSISK